MIGLLIKSTILWDLFSLFPAYAGVIPTAASVGVCTVPFPRIRGGDPKLIVEYDIDIDFSPHTRG